jgi:integration host factor subunit beta
MTKTDIIDKISIQSGLKRREVSYVVDNFITAIIDSTASGERVEIRGFGVFSMLTKKPRKIHSPIAGKVIDTPEKITIGFQPSSSVKIQSHKKEALPKEATKEAPKGV